MGEEHNTSEQEGFISRILHLFRPKIATKIFIYFLIIALVPLMTVSYVLVVAANDQLLKSASKNQQTLAHDLARRVDNYLAKSINLLAFEGRLYAANNFKTEEQLIQSLKTLFTQNAALQQVLMLTNDGVQRILTLQEDGEIKVEILSQNEQTGTAQYTEAIAFMVGKPYFISPGRDKDNIPRLTLGIPILKKYAPPNDDLFVSQKGETVNDLHGAILGYYDISSLWESVLSETAGEKSYAYIVDNSGFLITHPDQKFLFSHAEIKDTEAVRQFLNGDLSTKQTISEKNEEVISTPFKTQTNWAVIVQEPVSSIYASVNSYIQMSTTVGIVAVILSVLAGLFFSRQLIRPIKQLSIGAKRLGRGEFDQQINVKTRDELQELANTFNRMGMSIKKLISDLQTNNLRLMVEQAKLNNIISSVSDGIIALNAKGEIVSANPPAAKLVGTEPAMLEGKLLSDVFAWEHDEQRFTPDLKTVGIHRHTDLVLKRGSQVAYLDIMVAVLENQTGNVASIITIHDQTESRELSFMKLDFVAIAAHELRTPLTVVRGYLDILNSSAASKLNLFQLENLQKAIVGANQLRELINKLLNIARIERGDMEIFIEKLNLSKLVSENVEQHQPVAVQKEQKLSFNAGTAKDIYVPADTASIVEVLNNLIGNALKYTPKGGEIKVTLTATNNYARVEVKDNGPGVPNDMRDRLFTKFYRAERSLISGSRGTGLGLFISKTIIELQNGTIGIEPDQGHGSVFYFTLPIYDPARDDEQIAKNTSGGIRGWFKKRPTS